MAKKKSAPMGVRIIKAAEQPVAKSDVSTQLSPQESFDAGDWIAPPADLRGLEALKKNSTILPQCIRAYKNNIAGFGIGVRYIDDGEETPERAAELERAGEIIELLNIEQDTKEVFEDLIEARETYGIAYLEVIRNLAGEVVQIDFIKDTPSVEKTKPLEPYVPTVYYHHGKQAERKKMYCKYRQQIGGKTVYFREFGDPRIMDIRDGSYLKKGETLDLQYQANEIMEFAIGTEPYGEVRWIGQVLGIDGSRRAETLNNNYFLNGRHTPLMIMIEGGTLTDESFEKLQHYMNDIKGEAGQHAFIILETESTDARTDFDQAEKPTIEVKDLANILQKDELFQGYLDNNRRKVQSAFQLPDLYTGYTTDFNRATAQTAQEVTEEQVFQPERKSLAWAINNRLLNGYQFKYVEAYFLEPDISNPDDIYKLLTVCNSAGGLTPNRAKQIIYEAYGEVSEDYEGDWGNVPLNYSKAQQGGSNLESDIEQLTMSLQQQIVKAANSKDDEVVAVMKEVKRILQKDFSNTEKGSIIKTEEDGWVTVNGAKVHFDESGNVDIGPSGLKEWSGGGNFKPMLTEHFDLKTSEGDKAAQEAWSNFTSENMTQEQWDKLNGSYIGDAEAYDINRALRENPDAAIEDILSGKNLETALALQEAIDSNALESDTLLTRNVGANFLESTLGISENDFFDIVDSFEDEGTQERLKNWEGTTITEHGFVSTSGNPELNMFSTKFVRLEISATKGTNALVTQNYKESEVILNRGTTYKIEGFDKFDTDGQGYDFGLKIKVKVV